MNRTQVELLIILLATFSPSLLIDQAPEMVWFQKRSPEQKKETEKRDFHGGLFRLIQPSKTPQLTPPGNAQSPFEKSHSAFLKFWHFPPDLLVFASEILLPKQHRWKHIQNPSRAPPFFC